MNHLLQRRYGAYFDQFLAEIVAKLIGHGVWQDVCHGVQEGSREGRHPLLLISAPAPLLNLLLDHSAACLVKSELLNLFDDVNLLAAQVGDQLAWDHFTDAAGASLLLRFTAALLE